MTRQVGMRVTMGEDGWIVQEIEIQNKAATFFADKGTYCSFCMSQQEKEREQTIQYFVLIWDYDSEVPLYTHIFLLSLFFPCDSLIKLD